MKYWRSCAVPWALLAAIFSAVPVARATPAAGLDERKPVHSNVASIPDSIPGGHAAKIDSIGTQTCKTCHEDIYNNWQKTPHWRTTLDTKGGESRQGCEGCHGPGGAHVESGGDKAKIFNFKEHTPKEINDRCMTCHAGGTQHMNALNSVHAKNDVSCISCHSPHHAKESEFLLVKAQPELCVSCHLQQKAEFNMPFRHRVNEGLVQCTDCHNPHGT